ncbi:MAG: glutamine synthetase family protein [Eubacteriales bacterium]|nr:glutamine synthetase family protein [Eubacteriales bacterium]
MSYSYEEIIDFVEQEDVIFIHLAFTDAFGRQKKIAIPPDELRRAFTDGISFDASAIAGFTGVIKSDLFLFPIPDTLTILPWRSFQGKVVRMFCDIRYPDGTPYEKDSRAILKSAVKAARNMNLSVSFGSEFEFYLFNLDEKGRPTKDPIDQAGYMDVAPFDRGENIRREIVLTMKEIGIYPETSHHEEGPGQNEVDFRYSNAITAADNAMNFQTVVHAIAMQNGVYADFSPKPLPDNAGNGLHINMSVNIIDGVDDTDYTPYFMAGIIKHIKELSAFLNPVEESYKRLGEKKAPKYISWSHQNRSQLIRIPAAKGQYKRIELRSADPMTNPYIAYALLIYAGLDGIKNRYELPDPVDIDLYNADAAELMNIDQLPGSLEEARKIAVDSTFINSVLPENFLDILK